MIYLEKPKLAVEAFRPGIDKTPEWWNDAIKYGMAREEWGRDGNLAGWALRHLYFVYPDDDAPQLIAGSWQATRPIGDWVVWSKDETYDCHSGNYVDFDFLVDYGDENFNRYYMKPDLESVEKIAETFKADFGHIKKEA